MANKITVHQGDNGVKLLFTIKNNGLIEPLTDAKVTLTLKSNKTKEEVQRKVTITDSNNAEAEYILTKEDTANVDIYMTHLTTEYQNGTSLTYDKPFVLIVKESI